MTNICLVQEVSPQVHFTFTQSSGCMLPVLRSSVTVNREAYAYCLSFV